MDEISGRKEGRVEVRSRYCIVRNQALRDRNEITERVVLI